MRRLFAAIQPGPSACPGRAAAELSGRVQLDGVQERRRMVSIRNQYAVPRHDVAVQEDLLSVAGVHGDHAFADDDLFYQYLQADLRISNPKTDLKIPDLLARDFSIQKHRKIKNVHHFLALAG